MQPRPAPPLEEMGARLWALLQHAPVVHFTLDPDGVITLSEGRGLEGLGREPGEAVGRSVFELHAGTPWITDAVRRVLAGETVSAIGEVGGRWFKTEYVPFPDERTGRMGALGFAIDITDHKEAEEQLRESQERFRKLAEATFEGVAIHERGRIVVANEALARMFGYDDAAMMLGMNALDFAAPESRELVLQRIAESYEEPYEAIGLRLDGSRFHGELHSKGIRYDGRDMRVTAIRDISDRKQAEEQLRHAVLHDLLTGLPNRALFLDRLRHTLAPARPRGEGEARLFGVLLLDVDRFKTINDSLGHLVGDRLLTEIAARLASTLRGSDTLARFGGDEFTILLEKVEDPSEVVRVAERVQEALAVPLRIDGYEIVTSASIGIVVGRIEGYDQPESVLRDADTAMYRAKAQGRARYQLFDEAMHTRVSGLLQLETDLRHALERQELCLHYQRIASLADGHTAALEALLRWEHPKHGRLLPDAFLSIAEETGLMKSIGRWVLRDACRAVQLLREGGNHAPVIAVNLSRRQLFQPDFVRELRQILAETGTPGSCLQLEVTEDVLIEDAAAAVALLTEIRALGLELSIDDFGTGYSSLSQLHHLPVSVLKLDRSFVSRMTDHRESRELVRAIVALGHNLQLAVTAEGIETQAQLEQLRDLGCDYGQGYVFSEPLPIDDACERLRVTR